MHSILLQIIQKKQKDLYEQKKVLSIEVLKRKASVIKSENEFKNKLLHPTYSNMAIIAEIKLASPTIPSMGTASDIMQRAIAYENAGADAISVITEKHYFKGSPAFISQLKTKVKISILQKDFVIDPYQVYEAKIIGADALLLIAKIINKKSLINFVALCQEIGIEPIVEINDKEDLETAVATSTSIIAVNARNLQTFAVNVDQACRLMGKIPVRFIKLGFSGIKSASEVKKYQQAGGKGVLVGTSLMKAKNIFSFIQEIKKI